MSKLTAHFKPAAAKRQKRCPKNVREDWIQNILENYAKHVRNARHHEDLRALVYGAGSVMDLAPFRDGSEMYSEYLDHLALRSDWQEVNRDLIVTLANYDVQKKPERA